MSDETGRSGRIIWNSLNPFAVERFVITTYLDDAEIHRRLEEVIERRTWVTRIFRLYSRKDYLGQVSADGFQAEYVSIWLEAPPRVTGRFWNDGEHTLIEMTIRQHWGTILVAVSIAVAYVYLIVQLCVGAIPASFVEAAAVLLFVPIVFLFNTVRNTREIQRTKRFFRDLLEDIGEE